MPRLRFRQMRIAALCACALAVASFVAWEHGNLQHERGVAIEAWKERLTATAEDRELAIESWLDERRHDLELVATFPSIRALLTGRGEVDRRLRRILKSTIDAGSFESLALFDANGEARIELGEPRISPAALPQGWSHASLPEAAPRVAMTTSTDGRRLLAFVAEVAAEPPAGHAGDRAAEATSPDNPIGTVVATVDPALWLYDLLAREPAPTVTGESLLVAREAGRITYLSPRRNDFGTGPVVLALADDPAAEAALAGRDWAGELADYRGEQTLVAVRGLNPAPWGLLVKVDRREALEEWSDAVRRRVATWIGLSIAMALLLWGLRHGRRLRTLEEIAARDSKYRLLMEQAGDAILFVRPGDGRILEANRAAQQMYGLPAEKLRQQTLVELRAPSERPGAAAALAAATRQSGPPALVQQTLDVDASGHTFPVEVSLMPALVGGEKVLLAVVRDTRERWAAIERIERLNRTLATTSQINQLIAHERDPQRLLREACRVFVEGAGLRMAWVGRIAPASSDRPARLVPVAWAGLETGFLATTELPLDASDRGPARRAVIEDRAIVSSGESVRPEAWMRAAAERGYRSDAAVPMRRGGQVTGVLAAYSEVAEFFQPDVVAMLEELAADLELALSALEAEAALAESEVRYRSLFESSPQPMWVYDLETLRFLAVNDAAVRSYGWSRNEFLAMGIADIRPPEEVPALLDNVARVTNGFEDSGVWRHRRKDGQEILVHITSHTLEFENRRAEMVLATDVTEQRRAEAELQRAHELLRRVVEQSPAPIYTLAPDGEVTSWNRAAEEVFGWRADEAVGLALPLLQPEAEPELRTLRDRLLAGEEIRDLEAMRKRRDGTEIVLDLSAAPLRDAQGRVTGFVAVATDVTARKRAEQAVRRLAAELEDRVRQRTTELEVANRELEAFTYSVSHDLRAPLRAIEGFTAILAREHGERLDGEGRRLLGLVRTSAGRLSALLNDLLALSRAGRKGLTRERVAMRPLAAAALLETLPADSTDVDIVWSTLPDAWGDSSLLRQVWVNLLSNALKFSVDRPERRIEIGGELVGRAGGEVLEAEARYFVRDNGIGFALEDAANLFGVFQRLPGSERFEGNGVGLALVHRVVTRHGGRVWAESTPGLGACFYFTLPVPPPVR